MAIAASSVVLVVVWRMLPSASPPLYDGLCIADPYRNLGGTPAPSSASASYSGSQFPAAEVLTSETPPQAQILMTGGTFTAASSVTVAIAPAASPPPPPSGQVPDSNAYRITATAGGQELQPSSQDPATIVLRGSGTTSSATVYANSGSGWHPLRTFNVGCGFSFYAVSQKLGYFALFREPGASSGGRSAGGGFPVGIVIGILGVLIVVATIVLARISARRPR